MVHLLLFIFDCLVHKGFTSFQPWCLYRLLLVASSDPISLNVNYIECASDETEFNFTLNLGGLAAGVFINPPLLFDELCSTEVGMNVNSNNLD